MAITTIKSISGVYPAYNDSYIQLSSSLVDNDKMEVQVLPAGTFPNNFIVYKDLNNTYTFNLKNIVRTLLDTEGFEDTNDTPPVTFGGSLNVGYLSQSFGITISNGSGSSEIVSQSYEFIRGVKQIGEEIYSNTAQILNYSTNGVDYNLTYWEGFPFTFELQRITSGNTIYVKNLNTGVTSSAYTATSTNTYRYWVDKVSSNWTNSNFLPLTSTINKLEVYVNGVFRTNLNLKKIDSSCGVYLKWFNQDGGYSYWLFDEFYRDSLRNENIGEVARNEFLNVGEGLKNPVRQLGKTAQRRYRLKTEVDTNEVKVLESLFTSPSVQMYSSQQSFVSGSWIDVELTGDYIISNKKKINEVIVTVIAPEINTITL